MDSKGRKPSARGPHTHAKIDAAPATGRWFWPAVLGVLVVGACLRLLLLQEYLTRNLLSTYPLVDGETYWAWAGRIAAGQLVGTEPFFSGPFYPYGLGLVRALGGGLRSVYVLQTLCDLGTAALLAVIARRRFGPAVGVLSAAIFILMLEPAFYSTRVLAATIQLPLVCLAWWTLLAGQRRPTTGRAVAAGASLGLLTLACPPALLCLPVAAAWWWWMARAARSRPPVDVLTGRPAVAVAQGVVLLATGAAVIAPATLHNYAATGEFIAVSGQAGVTFAHGNAPGALGIYHVIPGVSANRETQNRDARRLCSQETGNPHPTWRQTERFFLRRGLENWWSRPGAALALFARKAYWFLTGRHWSESYVATAERDEGLLTRLWLTPLHTAWLLPPALLALAAWLRRGATHVPELMLFAAPLLVVLLFFYSPRYRFPAIPVVVVACAYALQQAWSWRKSPRWTAGLVGAVGLAATLTVANHAAGFDPIAPGRVRLWERVGGAAAATGRFAEALAANERALRLDPDNATAAVEASRAATQLGRPEQALEYARQAVRVDRRSAEAHNRLGEVLLALQQTDDAVACFRAAVDLAPHQAELHNNLGAALLRRGDLDGAQSSFAAALDRDASLPDAQLNLGLVLHQRGDLDAALRHFRAALDLKPELLQAQFHVGVILHAQGDLRGALAALRRAHELAPGNAGVTNHLAWCLATSPGLTGADRAAAVPLAEQAVAATSHQSPAMLDTLAAALAANGRYEEAAATARRALELAQEQGATALLNELRQRLELYDAGRPYVAPPGATERH